MPVTTRSTAPALVPPVMTVNDDSYEFTWPGTGLAVALRQIREGRDDVTAECLIGSTVAGDVESLWYGRLNLTSAQTRTSLAKTLAERVEFDWHAALNQVVLLAIDRWRSGDEPVNLASVAPRPGDTWLLSPYISLDGPTLLFGPGMSGKSMLALVMAYSVQTGDAIVGRAVGKPRKVLYLDWETSYETHAERLRAIAKGRHALPPPILHQRQVAPLASSIGAIKAQVAKNNIGLVVVDSLGMAAGGAPEEADSALAMFRALGMLRNVGILCLHHPNKSQFATGADKIFGSVYFFNASRIIWQMDSKRRDESTTVARLSCHKANYRGGLPDHAVVITVREDVNGLLEQVNVTPAPLADTPEFADKVPLGARVVEALKGGAKSKRELADELGLDAEQEHTLESRLSELKKRGKIVLLPTGQWGLAAVS